MKQLYFLLFLTLGLGGTWGISAQEEPIQKSVSLAPGVSEISIYPNPATQGKVTIVTQKTDLKQIEVFDVLGKKVIERSTYEKALDISKLSPGVYVIKIRQGDTSSTRKLVVR